MSNQIAILEAELATALAASRFHRGVLTEIGNAIGDEAFTDAAGNLHKEVLASKLPDLVEKVVAELAEAKGLLYRIQMDSFNDLIGRAIRPLFAEDG